MKLIERLKKIEAAKLKPDTRWIQIIKLENESTPDAIRRYGYDPDEQGLNFIVRVIC